MQHRKVNRCYNPNPNIFFIKKYLLLLIPISVFILVSSCALNLFPKPEILVTDVVVDNTISDDYSTAIVRFSLVNRANSAISSVSYCFDLYDTDGNAQPEVGNNHLSYTKEVVVPKEGSLSMSDSLDSVFTFDPQKSLTISRFRIEKIKYEDGSEWVDTFYMYYYPDDGVETIEFNIPSSS